MGIVLLTSITLTTIVYSVYNTKLQIMGEAMLRLGGDIRITGIKLNSQTGGGFETYNCKYGKNSTTSYVTLPSKSSMTYEVTITNKSNKDYDVSSIKNLNNINSNIDANFSLIVGNLISKNSTKTFTITFTNNTSIQQVGTLVYQYSFAEHINSYVVGNYSLAKYYTLDIPYTGEYKIELWGASGGNAAYNVLYSGGNGSFAKGNVVLEAGTKIGIYVGGQGESHSGTTEDLIFENGKGYNGGTAGGFQSENSAGGGGGGATDVRLIVSDDWSNEQSLASRIIVAAGGGGAKSHRSDPNFGGHGGAAGGLTGYDSDKGDSRYYMSALGATQIHSGTIVVSPEYSHLQPYNDYSGFGKGGFVPNCGICSGGGGGYYGGGHGYHSSASGGSSFISGYLGCIAVSSQSDLTPVCSEEEASSDVSCSYHYSGYKFTDTQMIDGKGEMISPSGTIETGHIGNGYARITFIKRVFDYKKTENKMS